MLDKRFESKDDRYYIYGPLRNEQDVDVKDFLYGKFEKTNILMSSFCRKTVTWAALVATRVLSVHALYHCVTVPNHHQTTHAHPHHQLPAERRCLRGDDALRALLSPSSGDPALPVLPDAQD